MSERIAIVGASVRAAAAAAVRAGFTVAAADLFADADLAEIADATQIEDYPARFADWLRALSPRPKAWLYTGALENHPDLVDQMAAIAPLWGNSGAVLRQVRSPWRLAEVLAEAGLRFPAMQSSPEGLPRDGSWLVKTGRGASGSGVANFKDASTVPVESFYQQRISGAPYSAVFVAHGGKAKLLGIVRQLVGEVWLYAKEFQYCGAIGPWRVCAKVVDEIGRIGDTLADRFKLRGLFGVDFILEGDRVWTIEVNPRYPASAEVIEWATGVSPLAAHAAEWGGRSTTIVDKAGEDAHFCKAILFSRRQIAIDWKLNELFPDIRCAPTWPASSDLPRVGTRIEKGHPVLTLFARGATPEEVVTKLKARVAIVERQLYPH